MQNERQSNVWFVFIFAVLFCALVPLVLMTSPRPVYALILVVPICLAIIACRGDSPPGPTHLRLDAKRAPMGSTAADYVANAVAETRFIVETHARWNRPNEVQRLTGELTALGFVKIDDYSILQQDGDYMREFFHPTENLMATISQDDDRTVFGMSVQLESGTAGSDVMARDMNRGQPRVRPI